MDHRSQIREFLTSRRARISPQQAGLPSYGTRRVPGLRRAEVAQLAGVSVEYYSRLERGDLSGVSEHVLDALARALRLDDAERTHLEDLARAAGPGSRRRRRPAARAVRAGVQRLLASMTGAPAFVMNGRGDVLATNALGRALYAPMIDAARGAVPNHARFIFLDPRSRLFWGDWDRAADDTVALLHAQAGRDPYDKDLTDLVGELSTRSEDFRTRWARHDVRQHHLGAKPFHHPVVGDLHLTYESLTLAADDLTLVAYGTQPGSDSEDRLRLLASWAASSHSGDDRAREAAPEPPKRLA
ncbi:transcriptional regulator with XRE-family HTH domain [Streptosporangium becharense]|uniref:Transcriptional regulator with XRE-family HTH domain n=1 Tax=Streptosporangium becharense TaxID=1816182 RepID=A0A7W9IMT3_9ACTN|nr:helix-turn-helix domain-containing protein [Streptosporangium becharense]MBB2914391.1 transcriptional regulator with XRE-family HTH domain [Streptosporangium becharense]MBB5823577.1 transcriptional regulator with XRE-family HTH domain [Streptosporangium becharense]